MWSIFSVFKETFERIIFKTVLNLKAILQSDGSITFSRKFDFILKWGTSEMGHPWEYKYLSSKVV